MADMIKVTGMVLSDMAIGEYDKRLVLLTKERGKINGFARGARRPGNSMMAASQAFVFGEFMLKEGRGAYTIVSAKVLNYFEAIRSDMDAYCYGCYFLEFANYYTRENADDLETLKLVYQTVLVLCKRIIPNQLLRCIFELKLMAVNGECPILFECAVCKKQEELLYFSPARRGLLCGECRKHGGAQVIPMSEAAVYTVQYIVSASIEKLYTFTVSEEVLKSLADMMNRYRRMYVDRKFKSLDILTLMEDDLTSPF